MSARGDGTGPGRPRSDVAHSPLAFGSFALGIVVLWQTIVGPDDGTRVPV